MASSSPMECGEVGGPNGHPGPGDLFILKKNSEEALRQINSLIVENRDLKEALKQTVSTMKVHFEELSAWKEKHKDERNFLEGKLAEVKENMSSLAKCNDELETKLQTLEGNAPQLEEETEVSDLPASNKHPFNLHPSGLELEKQTVNQLLLSLRMENQKLGGLQLELQAVRKRIAVLESLLRRSLECEAQTEPPGEDRVQFPFGMPKTPKHETRDRDFRKEETSTTEVDNLKVQMMSLSKHMQQLLSKLEGAENLKISLNDKCTDFGQELTGMTDRRQVQEENERLRAQLDDLQKVGSVEAVKELARWKDVYSRLLIDYNELKENQKKKVSDPKPLDIDPKPLQPEVLEEEMNDLHARLSAADQAGVAKQQKIDQLRQEISKKDRELRNISKSLRQVPEEIEKLKVQLGNGQKLGSAVQRTAEEEAGKELARLKDAYSRLLNDYDELKEKNQKKKPGLSEEEMNDLHARLSAAEQAGVAKQQELTALRAQLADTLQVQEESERLKAQLLDRRQVQEENERLKAQLDDLQKEGNAERRKAEEAAKTFTRMKAAYSKHLEDCAEMEAEKKKKEVEMMDLRSRLSAAEEALAVKQLKIDEMKQEIFKKEEALESISLFQTQAEVYAADFRTEREAREKIHEEKVRLEAELEQMKENLGRQAVSEIHRRHTLLVSPQSTESTIGAAVRENLPEYACPKCNESLPDLDSLQVHIMDCIT